MNKSLRDIPKEIYPDNVILCGYRGSVAHNTYIPNDDPNSVDDIDILGVYLAPTRYYIGLGKGKIYRKAVERFIGQYDAVFYEIKKVMNMLLAANPNVLSLLWLKDEYYISISPAGRRLIEIRDAFLSKDAVFNSFTGYARGQMKRMTNFTKRGYMGKKRKALVEKYGFDTKNASHLLRLLRMSTEILRTGRVNVFREDDAEMLKEVKMGMWPLEDVKKGAEVLFEDAKNAYEHSILPEKPDEEKVELALEQILFSYLHNNKIYSG